MRLQSIWLNRSSRARVLQQVLAHALSLIFCVASVSAAEPGPLYKPSSRSPEPIDILSNAYGASRDAPAALELGDTAPDFRLRRAGGGEVSLQSARNTGPVAIIFYRGHW